MYKKVRYLAVVVGLLLGLSAFAGCAGMDMDEADDKKNANAAQLAGIDNNMPNAMSELTPEQAKDPKALEAKADGLVMHGDMGSALYLYQKADSLAEEKDKPRLNTKIGFVHLREGRYQIAHNILSSTPKPKEIAYQIWLGLGLAQVSLGMISEAEDSLSHALDNDNVSWKAYNALGVIHNKKDEPEKALEMFDQALRRQPKVAALYNNRGLSYMMLGRKNEAEKSFWQALKLDSGHKLARNNLALLYSSDNRWDEARRAFELSVGEAKAYNNVGVLMAHEGNYLDASEQFRKAVEKNPTYYSLADQNLENAQYMAHSKRIDAETDDSGKDKTGKTAKPKKDAKNVKVEVLESNPHLKADNKSKREPAVIASAAGAMEKPRKNPAPQMQAKKTIRCSSQRRKAS